MSIHYPKFIVVLCVGLSFAIMANAQQGSAGADVRPNALTAQLSRAQIAFKSGASLLEAKVRVDRVLKQLPNDVEALKLRSKILVSMDRHSEALTDARRAAAVAPDDGEAHLLVAVCAIQVGNRELTVRSMNRTAGLLVDDAYSHVELSRMARLMGQMEKAEAYARIAVALQRGNSACQLELARAFVAQKKFRAAVLVLDKAIENGIVDPMVVDADPLLEPISKDLK